MNLEELLRLKRVIKVIGFDDAPFQRQQPHKVPVAGIICGITRIARCLGYLSDRGKVPEALRLAHLITAAVVTGKSGKRA